MATSSTTHTHGNATLATEHRQCRWLEAHFQDGFAVLSSDANTTSASTSCSARADSDRRPRPCRAQIQAGVERLIGCPFWHIFHFYQASPFPGMESRCVRAQARTPRKRPSILPVRRHERRNVLIDTHTPYPDSAFRITILHCIPFLSNAASAGVGYHKPHVRFPFLLLHVLIDSKRSA